MRGIAAKIEATSQKPRRMPGFLFGDTRGVIVCDAFCENVSRHKIEGLEIAESEVEENVVLQFQSQPG